jgi:DNA-binding response OmpR family regulator
MSKVLVVDDVKDTTNNLVRLLRKEGYDAIASYSEERALEFLGLNAFDVVVTDMWMEKPDSGMSVLREAKRIDPHVEVIVLTAYGDVKTAVTAIKLGAFDYIEKVTEDYKEKDVYDIIATLVSRCIDSRQGEALYEVFFKSHVEPAYPRQIQIYRDQKSDYEIFVDDEYGKVYVSGNEVDIRDLPYRILVYLMENRGALRSPITLHRDVWNDPDGWVLGERSPEVLKTRVKTRISDLRGKLDLPSIKIDNNTDRYGLLVPDGVDYCLIKETETKKRQLNGKVSFRQNTITPVEILRGARP